MIRIAWNRILHRKIASITILIALICLYVFIPFGLQQSKETKSTVTETIEEFGRGSYDMLVRPPSSRTEVEQTLGVVEENYIGDSKGGISIEEWNEIKSNPTIEVAAPVASLGYFRGKQFSIELPILDNPTRFTYQFYTSDGQKKYPIKEQKSIMFFEQSRPGMVQYLTRVESEAQYSSPAMLIIIPASYYLLVAIDQESEQKLTGIDFSDLNKKQESAMLKTMLDNYGDPPVVKVLQRSDLTIPLSIKLRTETLDVELEEYLNKLDLKQDDWIMQGNSSVNIESVLKDLRSEPIVESNTTRVDLSKFQKPFNGTALKLTKDLKPTTAKRYSAEFNTSVYYTASRIEYKNLDTIPQVNLVENGDPPSYKKVEKKGESMLDSFDIPFFIEQVGTFSPLTDPQNKLAGSPLGIYGGMQAKTVDGEVLTPTTIPGSFIPAPASGVTTLEAAELIKGDKPIDAIRVKVAGIKKYDEAAQQKISKVATNLLKKGYEVDVVAGSSFKELTLDVEGIGKVVEPWTTLGVAQELTSTWNYVTLLTTGLFILFSVLWLIVRFNYEKNILHNENTLLYTIGWKKSTIHFRNCVEQYLLITVSFLVSLFLLYGLEATKPMYWITACLWGLSLLIVTYLLTRKAKGKNRSEAYKRFASILYYKRLIFPAMMILLLSSLLIGIQVSTLGHSFQKASVTFLGEFTNNQTLWLQLSILVATFVLGVISVTESLNALFLERKSEFTMYRTIGWTRGAVIKHLIKEVSTWTLSAIIAGVVLGATILHFLNVSFGWIGIGMGTTFILLTITIYIIVLTRKL
ncbi:FtsX-like permease family protein [Terrihalobacillus insolitus]|uniref:FtsX-like permease family protein n=1 Tax=Terrihalobacillus insolitus TaxID=2950438 RepID=UPI0023414C9B|nr:FtsX-like permease family protein [Terrihalobacillus insolitus]MDC3411982.1 hypothetical protein [Terrihalobacillus insolitus]